MRHRFISSFLILMGMTMLSFNTLAAPQKAEFFGGIETEYPSWFKESFLDLREDLIEATEAGKRLVIFFHQDGCPYCNALVERNFAQKEIAEKAQKNFDIITLNMWGDRHLTSIDGKEYLEKTFAEKLRVQFTPTVLFFDEQGKVVLRINGYHSPQRFSLDLDYVALHKEKETSYRDFMKANWPDKKANKNLNAEPYFSKPPYDFSAKVGKKGKPFVVFFEQKDCPNCDALHKDILPDADLLAVLKQFDVTQLDMWSKTPIVTPEGKKMMARQWAKQLDVKYAPSIVVFNTEGKEVIRAEASFKVFHTQGILNYVLSEGYKEQPSFQRYLTSYADHIREQGKAVDIWRTANEKVGKKKH